MRWYEAWVLMSGLFVFFLMDKPASPAKGVMIGILLGLTIWISATDLLSQLVAWWAGV